MDEMDIQKMAIALAELRADIKYLSHDVRNLTLKMETRPTDRDHGTLAGRIDNLEKNQAKVAWAIISAWIGGLGVVGVLATVVSKIT